MQGYFAIATVIMLVVLVLSRALLLKSNGVKVMRFGQKDKSDFLILPFALFFIYLVLAGALGWPKVGFELFDNDSAR